MSVRKKLGAVSVALAASVSTLVVLPAEAEAGGCGVSSGTLWCTNRVSPVYNKPSYLFPPSDHGSAARESATAGQRPRRAAG